VLVYNKRQARNKKKAIEIRKKDVDRIGQSRILMDPGPVI